MRRGTRKRYIDRLSDAQRRRLRRRLLGWFRKAKRDLPWRRTRDPYAIWAAEVMLQQTQVGTALPYYERFLARFPTIQALARASDEAVLKTWQGLGYYRRALNLQAAARRVVREHGGRVPSDPAVFAALPGVGRYTCGAVQSIAFGRRLAALDGNAARIISRWLAVTDTVTGGAAMRGLWEAAEALVPQTSPGDWNQAVMELGSAVCMPRGPRCGECPVAEVCIARARGIQERIPKRRKRKAVPHIEVGVGIIWRGRGPIPPHPTLSRKGRGKTREASRRRGGGRVLLCRRRPEAMLGGLWEFPGGKRRGGESIRACIRRELREECGLEVEVGEHLVDVMHAYSHLRVTLRCYHGRAPRGRARALGCTEARWVRPGEIAEYPLPAADVKILRALRGEKNSERGTRNAERKDKGKTRRDPSRHSG